MKRVVALGGGTGMPVLIDSLLEHVATVDAVITVADDGGSSGRLREELGAFPAGDSRNCLVAMSPESVLASLFQYRFPRGEGLKSHALGNLIISALTDISGDYRLALETAGELLGARGRVFPPSVEPLTLYADVEPWPGSSTNGQLKRVFGQCNVANRLRPLRSIGIIPEGAPARPEALEAIAEADVIILGPGSLFTSVMANLLVEEIGSAVRDAKAKKIFLGNTTVQRGETDGYTAVDHYAAVAEFAGITPELFIASDTKTGAECVEIDRGRLLELEIDHIIADLTDETAPTRHDPAKLSMLWREIL